MGNVFLGESGYIYLLVSTSSSGFVVCVSFKTTCHPLGDFVIAVRQILFVCIVYIHSKYIACVVECHL